MNISVFVYGESTCGGFKVIKQEGRDPAALTNSAHTALM